MSYADAEIATILQIDLGLPSPPEEIREIKRTIAARERQGHDVGFNLTQKVAVASGFDPVPFAD